MSRTIFNENQNELKRVNEYNLKQNLYSFTTFLQTFRDSIAIDKCRFDIKHDTHFSVMNETLLKIVLSYIFLWPRPRAKQKSSMM